MGSEGGDFLDQSENQFNAEHDMVIKTTEYLQNGGCGSHFSFGVLVVRERGSERRGVSPQKGGGAFKAHSTLFADSFKFPFFDLF